MANSFEPLVDRDKSAGAPGWIAHLQVSTGFVANDWQASDTSQAVLDENGEDAVAFAFREGEAAGREAAKADLAIAQANQEKFKLMLGEFNEVASKTLKSTLADTVAAICEQIIEPGLIDREAINCRCDAAIMTLGTAPSKMKLHLHPDDLALLELSNEAAPQLIADEKLSRGSIRLESPDGLLSDGPEDWRRILREALNL